MFMFLFASLSFERAMRPLSGLCSLLSSLVGHIREEAKRIIVLGFTLPHSCVVRGRVGGEEVIYLCLRSDYLHGIYNYYGMIKLKTLIKRTLDIKGFDPYDGVLDVVGLVGL